jgi:carbon starvation protein
MTTLLIAIASFVGFVIAYHTYGRWLGQKIFELDDTRTVPSISQQDGVDFVPTDRSIVFGHHFTSIAGTGPIVGPALAVFWGWLPALVWVVLGSIFIGAVHDLGSLVVSLRHHGQTIGEISGRMISPRAKLLFLVTLFFSLTVVLGIFGLVIASIFSQYPESVLPVWVSLPVAIWIGVMVKRGSKHLLLMSLVSFALIYVCVYLGAYHFPIAFDFSNLTGETANWVNRNTVWTVILLVYCGIASVLPVWLLLQPRDYVNSIQLLAALALLVVGLLVACVSGKADLIGSTPAIVEQPPADAPPILPFLFITIACGAISGFHCLVSSGTSSKQLKCESDAIAVGYGSMLLEGALAVVVILACCAGVGMGEFSRTRADDGAVQYAATLSADGAAISGREAWENRYGAGKAWAQFRLQDMIGAFIFGGANFLAEIGIPLKMAVGIIAVLVGSFAATTLDSATRLQRYVIQELGATVGIKPLTNRYMATTVAVLLGAVIAFQPNAAGLRGAGGIMLWPLFGATNQLLAGLAFMVILFFLWRRGKPIWFVAIPMGFMLLMPAAALIIQLFDPDIGWVTHFGQKKVLAIVGLITLGIQVWMLVEGLLAWPKAKGVIESSASSPKCAANHQGGRSC